MMKIRLMIFIQLSIILTCNALQFECLNDSNNFYCKLGTITPYRYVANYNESQFNYPGCKSNKIWSIIRHGTRYPGKKIIKSMINQLPELRKKILESFKANKSELSLDLIQKFADWELSINADQVMILAEEGEDELIDLAERMQARFPYLFVEKYSKELYKFKFTASQRTEMSAKSFALGLFGQQYSANISFPEPEHEDPILRFYKRCERWRITIDKNPYSYKEKDLFLQSEICKKMLFDISKRVGINLEYKNIELMFKICAFETAWSEITKSPWCNIFTLDDAKIFEFIDDLEYYWIDGYGNSLNYEQACSALRDVFSFFESTDKTIVTTYFAHSGTILKLLSLIGIAKEAKPLTHDSFTFHKDVRNWRLSLIDAFASNIAFVLYDCDIQGPSILVLHQERPVQIAGCPVGTPCPMAIMKRIYPDTEEECNFEQMCSM